MVSKESKALKSKIADGIKLNTPIIAFDPGGNSLTSVTDQYELIKDCNNNVIDKKLKVFKVNTKHYYHEMKIKLAKRIVDQHWQVKDIELQTHKVNSTVALMKFINFDAKIIKQNYKIINAFHLVKRKIQDKHEKIYIKNGKTSYRSVLCYKNNIK